MAKKADQIERYVIVYETGYHGSTDILIKETKEEVINTILSLTNKEPKHQYDERVEIVRVFKFDVKGRVVQYQLRLNGFKLTLAEIPEEEDGNSKVR